MIPSTVSQLAELAAELATKLDAELAADLAADTNVTVQQEMTRFVIEATQRHSHLYWGKNVLLLGPRHSC